MINKLIISLLTLSLLSSCHYISGKRVKGNGDVVTVARETGAFTGIDVSGSADIYIKQDSSFSVNVETDANLQGHFIVETQGDMLRIRPEHNVNLRPTRLKVYVSAPLFKRLDASGACQIYSENRINSDNKLYIDLSGASDVKLELKTPGVEAELSGAGTVELKGETKDLKIDGSGSTKIRCFGLMAENVNVDLSGAGNAEVFASVKLDVEVSGAGDVKYKGSPSVSHRISGAGSVKKVD